MRRVDPDDPRFVCPHVAIIVGEIGFEEEGIAWGHQVGGVIDGQLDRSRHEIADSFALMRDEVDFLAAGRDHMNIGLEQVASRHRDQSLIGHAGAAAERVDRHLQPLLRPLHQFVLVDLESEERCHVAIQGMHHLVEHRERRHDLASLDL